MVEWVDGAARARTRATWRLPRRRRVARHLLLDGFGLAAQERLAASRVVVVGAGGLGSPVLQYLAAAGVGTLGIIDDDVVEASNLQRQVLHSVADVGRAKTASATDVLRGLAPTWRWSRTASG